MITCIYCLVIDKLDADAIENCVKLINNDNISQQERIHMFSLLNEEIIFKMLQHPNIAFTKKKITLFMIIKLLQHPSFLNEYMLMILHSIHTCHVKWFNNAKYLNLLQLNIKKFIFFLKKKQKSSIKYLQLVLSKSTSFSSLSTDIIQRIGENYLKCSNEDINKMVDKLGVLLVVLRKLQQTHIEYYYRVAGWKIMMDQPNQQGAIDAEEERYYFLQTYDPVKKHWGNIFPDDNITSDFSYLYLQWC